MTKPLRRLWLGLQTVLGLRRSGFFIPHRYASELPSEADLPPFGAVKARFEAQETRFKACLEALEAYEGALAVAGSRESPAPRWDQDWFAPLDGAMAYFMVRHHRPQRIVEIGAGHSTRFFHQAILDAKLKTHQTAIEPAPKPPIRALAREKRIDLIESMVHKADLSLFAGLEPGDILSLDGSHILMPGTDVDVAFNRILPLLPAGVMIHVHDVFLPDPYPASWRWRGYNEQNALAGLIALGALIPHFASQYVVRYRPEWIETSLIRRLAGMPRAPESSFWGVLRPLNLPENENRGV